MSLLPNKTITTPTVGGDTNLWGGILNVDLTNIDLAFGGKTTVSSLVGGTYSLSSSECIPPNIVLTGSLTSNLTVQIPAGVGGMWSVYNNTVGAYTVSIVSAGGGSSFAITQAARTIVVSDGTSASAGVTIPASVTPDLPYNSVQINGGGAFSGSDDFTVSGTTVAIGTATTFTLDVRDTIKLTGNTSGYVGLKAAAAAGGTTYTLPTADGAAGQVLSTDGAGTLAWAAGGGGGSGGTTTYAISFNDSNAGGASPISFDGGTSGQVVSANTLGAIAESFFTSNQLLAQSGYQALPGGLLIQWGYSHATTASRIVTFPTTFSGVPYACVCSTERTTSPGAGGSNYVYNLNASGVTLYFDLVSAGNYNGWWIAVGPA